MTNKEERRNRKERFVNDVYGTRPDRAKKNYLSQLLEAEKYEGRYSCDLALLPAQAVIEMMTAHPRTTYQSVMSAWSLLNKYVDWCISEGYSVSANIAEAKKQEPYAGLCVIKSPAHLEEVLNAALRPIKDNTIDNTLRVIMWACYAGISDLEKIAQISVDDIDFKNQFIYVGDKIYRLYDEAVPVYKRMKRVKKFNDPGRKTGATIMKQDATKIASFSANRSTELSPAQLFIKTRNVVRARGSDVSMLSYELAYQSGRFYRAYLRELAGVPFKTQNLAEFFAGRKITDPKKLIHDKSAWYSKYLAWRTVAYPDFEESNDILKDEVEEMLRTEDPYSRLNQISEELKRKWTNMLG